MTDNSKQEQATPHKEPAHTHFIHKLDKSAILVIIGVILLFSTSVAVVLVAPTYVDSTWTSPSSPYQVQMYKVEDPNIYISSASTGGADLQYVRHLKQDFTLLAFKESNNLRLVAPKELEKYITRTGDPQLKLTSRLLMLREPQGEAKVRAEQLSQSAQQSQKSDKPQERVTFQVLELYDPGVEEAFSFEPYGGILQNWVDENFAILDESVKHPYHQDYGVIYAQNPQEFRISTSRVGNTQRWRYDPNGRPLQSLAELKSPEMGFHSREELIYLGEHIYAVEGCWYCHTDQTRTLIQDTVLNGSDSFPAPPSSANEYIYQKITFAGTRRIGPDISRVGVKKPSRDWHKAHFWAPKTASAGSIMPSFQHFFDNDPRGTGKSSIGIPNHRFEAIYQYMMTKGTRITAPTQAWWLGKDPIKTKEIIEGQRVLK
ncbi:putative cytochrome oxidase, cytochrome c subunit [Candidatus Protochlamydia naegleriophila]|uniref:Putative cytochrome oxidase, cytochrome c subunit n=1 Tax=Candidatus Protochlamydia naegleriophila TaxID=389348 RepID=A0A0U5EP33_9BACT|nr:cbb3-type cytochrome c oxidase subunit II [Candidatus Protochlamydia naegleriophila]CUI15667.1 putative cytochrome oxidase, cytochrome c subunit [Candidatus Protochlamydia naegleriophila]